MNLKKKLTALAVLTAMTASMTAVPASAYDCFNGTPPDVSGITLYLNFQNTDQSLVIENAVVEDGIFDDLSDFYGMTNKADGETITAENMVELWDKYFGGEKNPNYKWGDWVYGLYDLTVVRNETGEAFWEEGKYRSMPDFPLEKEVTDSGVWENYGTENQTKISDKTDYHFIRQEDGTLFWTNGIQSRPELDVCYTVLATKLECVTYTRNDSEPLPIDTHIFKSLVERDLYLSSMRGFSNSYSIVYEGNFRQPTLYKFSDSELPEEYQNEIIHYRMVDFYDTMMFEDGYIRFDENGNVKDRFVERSGMISPDGKAGLTLVMDETPQMKDYFWTKEVPITKIDENGEEVPDGTFEVPQPEHSGIIQKTDVNMDGETNVTDVVALHKYLLGKETISFGSYLNADANADGKVNIFDLALLKKQLINSRTAEESPAETK